MNLGLRDPGAPYHLPRPSRGQRAKDLLGNALVETGNVLLGVGHACHKPDENHTPRTGEVGRFLGQVALKVAKTCFACEEGLNSQKKQGKRDF